MGNESFGEIRKKQVRKIIAQFIFGLTILFAVGSFAYRATQDTQSTTSTTDTSQKDPEPSDDSFDLVSSQVCLGELPPDLTDLLERELSNTQQLTSDDNSCTLILSSGIVDSNRYNSLYHRVYTLVSRADQPILNVTWADLKDGLNRGSIDKYKIYLTDEASFFIDAMYGTSTRGLSKNVTELIDTVLNDPNTLAILPIEELLPKVKSVAIDGITPFSDDLYVFTYPLSGTIWSTIPDQEQQDLYIKVEGLVEEYFGSNSYDQENVRSILLTGRSAIGSRSLFSSENSTTDNLFSNITTMIKDADISILNNESSFIENCSQSPETRILCSLPIEQSLISDIGFDIVGVSGQSVLDVGRPAFESTLSGYLEQDLGYYGGGMDREEAKIGVTIEQDKLKMFLTGFSLVTPTRYLSTDRSSGTLAPDKVAGDGYYLSETLLDRPQDEIQIVDMQWGSDISSTISEQEKNYALRLVGAGADLVFGTNSIIVKPMEYIDSVPIFYGLGDFAYPPDKGVEGRSIMVRLYLYNGQFLTYELIPTTIDDSGIIDIDMDSYGEILNTVYENTNF